MSITSKGIIQSTETAIYLVIIISIVFFFLSQASNETKKTASETKQNELETKSLLIATSLIETSSQNPLLGSAFFDSKKHRTEENTIDLEKITQIKNMEIGNNLEAKEISLLFSSKEKTILKKERGKNCVSIKRSIRITENGIIIEKNGFLRMVVCNE